MRTKQITRKHKVRPFGMEIKTGGTGAILAKLFRKIMEDLQINEQDRYDALMLRWIQKAVRMPNGEKIAAIRTGLSKELMKETISWKTFIRGLEFLYVEKFEITILLEHRDETVTKHYHSSPIVEESQSGVILADLLHRIYVDLKIVGDTYSSLMNDYIDSCTRTYIDKRHRATMRASLSKELLKNNMTWKTFVKGLVFLQIPSFTIHMKLHHLSKKTTEHITRAVLDGISADKLEEADA